MPASLEELIAEKLMNFMMFLTSIIGDKVSQEKLQLIAGKLEALGTDIKTSIKEADSKLRYLEEDNKYLRQQISELTKENEQLKQRINGLSRELRKFMSKYIKIKRTLRRVEEEKAELEGKIRKLEEQIEGLEDENARLSMEIADLTEKKNTLEAENKELKDRIAYLEHRLEECEKRLEEFESRLIKAANMVKREITDEAFRFRDMIRHAVTELRTYVVPQGRAKLQRISSLVNTLCMRVSSKDLGGAILRYIREE